MASAVGEVVAERWELSEVVGRGGHSVIYRARDLTGGGDVAVKMLHEGMAGNQELTVRMVREHRALEMLVGTAAVRVHGLCTNDDGALCLVMELLRGRDLDDELAAAESGGGRMSARRLLDLLEPIVHTLDRAHDHDIVHRDIKPGNVFVLDEAFGGGVRLLDFGLAKVRSGKPLTREDMIIGSPSYIAPEIWNGHAARSDHRVDVYALGVIVFRVLAGHVPFDAQNLKKKLDMVTKGERPSLHALRPDLPSELDEWVHQALAIDPERRFFRVRAMWSALRDVLGLDSEGARAEPAP